MKNNYESEIQRIFSEYHVSPSTRQMIMKETGISLPNFKWCFSKLKKQGKIILFKRDICPISGCISGYYTVNPILLLQSMNISKPSIKAKINPSFPPEILTAKTDNLKNQIDLGNETQDGIYTATQLLNRNIESIPCLLEPILQKVGLCGFAGSSDTGKSSFLRQLAVAVCLGESEFLGFKLNSKNNSAIYVSTEDEDYAIANLLNKSNKEKKLDHEKFKGLTFIFDTHNLFDKIEKLLAIKKTDLIVIDAFTDIYGNSMNDTNQVRTFLNQYSQLARKHNCLIIFLHHTGKRTEDLAPSKNNLLGSQGFEAKMRLVIELRTDHLDPDKRHLCIVKGNYLPSEFKTKSFVLDFNKNLQFSNTGEKQFFETLKKEKDAGLRKKIIKMADDGKTQTEIGKILDKSQATVSRLLKR